MGGTVRAPSPRIVGIAVLVVSGVVGVCAAATIPHPEWGIIAAIVLAVASVGALAGLLLLFRRGWADRSWPPGMKIRQWDPRRQRRAQLIYGIFLLTVSVSLGASLLAGGIQPDASRGWILLVLVLVLSAALIVAGLLRPRPVLDPTSRPADEEGAGGASWLRLGADGSAVSLSTALSGTSFASPVYFLLLLPVLTRVVDWALLVALLALAVGAAVVVLIVRRLRRSPEVAADGSAIRSRGTAISADHVFAARIVAIPPFDTAIGRSVSLVLESSLRRTSIGLRKNGRLTLGAAATTALSVFLARSAIEIPRDKEDPRGRFSQVLYPTHLTREAAVALVQRPPADGEPLPIHHGPPAG